MKKIISFLFLATLIFSLVACGKKEGNNDQGNKVEDNGGNKETPGKNDDTSKKDPLVIEFYQQKGEEGPQKGYQALIDKFNEENPDIKVEMNTVPDPVTVLTSRISSGDIPVMFSDFPTQMQFKQKVANEFVQDLSEQEFLKNVNESSLEMTKQPDGGYYALPYTRNYIGVYYNIDMFEEHGVEIPKTWDEFIAVCEKFEAAGITAIGLAAKDPGRVGHFFQPATVAFSTNGVEIIEAVVRGEEKLEGNAEFTEILNKMLTLFKHSNDDALALSDVACYENFANGQYAMTITGSYARGTIQSINSELNVGIFPLPNETEETTTTLSGIDSAICVSAKATDEEKAAAYRFLEFLSRPESAEIFLQYDGAPTCIDNVTNDDEGITAIVELINNGQTHDWMGSTINNNVVTDLSNVIQGFWAEQNIENTLKNMDASIAITSAE